MQKKVKKKNELGNNHIYSMSIMLTNSYKSFIFKTKHKMKSFNLFYK